MIPDRIDRGQRFALALIVAFCASVVGVLVVRDLSREAPRVDAVPAVSSGEKEEVRTSVRVVPTACNLTASGRMRMDGYILNTGTRNLQYVTVRALWKNGAGQPIGNETFYALNGELSPGERHPFSHTTDRRTAQKCNAEPVDWW